MLNIKIIRENKEALKESIKRRKMTVDLDHFLELDADLVKNTQNLDALRAEKNKVSKEIPKLNPEERAQKIEEMKLLNTQIDWVEENGKEMKEELNLIHHNIPNLLHSNVPDWKDDTENPVIKTVWKIPEFNFKVLDHEDILVNLWLLNKEKAWIITWSRFFYLFWDAVKLQNAIVSFTFDILTSQEKLAKIIKKHNLNVSDKPFTLTIPPLMVRYETMDRMWRLHPMDDRYCHPEDEQVLIWSAEHSLWPLHMDEILEEKDLPIRYVACTPAFRREAGTYGKDSRGILRTHQFDKIEMESFTTSSAWFEEHKLFNAIQQELTEQLWVPFQVVQICTWDIGKPDIHQLDIECYMPGQSAYRETHTADYMADFQSYSLKTRIKLDNWDKEYAHMNDATAFALGRILIAIIENNQQEDWSIKVPEVLRNYMWNQEFIGKK